MGLLSKLFKAKKNKLTLDDTIEKYIINNDIRKLYVNYEGITEKYLEFFKNDKDNMKRYFELKDDNGLNELFVGRLKKLDSLFKNQISFKPNCAKDPNEFVNLSLAWISHMSQGRDIPTNDLLEFITSILITGFSFSGTKPHAIAIKNKIFSDLLTEEGEEIVENYLIDILPIMFVQR